MEKAEIIISNYHQEEKDEALVDALKSQNSVLIELALKLKPNLAVGGGALLNYAVVNADIALLGELLWMPEISDNQGIMDEAVRLAVLSERMEWFDVLQRLVEEGADKDVALATLFERRAQKNDRIMWLVENGASAYIQPMHFERNPNVVEEIFKAGYGKNIDFSSQGFYMFAINICQNNNASVVKALVKDRPDFVEQLIKIAVLDGYPQIVKLLCKEGVITTIDENLFEKAIYKNHYYVVKHLVEQGVHKVEYIDVVRAAGYAGTAMLKFFLEEIKKNEPDNPSRKQKTAIYVACVQERKENALILLKEGYPCDFDRNIQVAAVNGSASLIEELMDYATSLNMVSFEEAINLAIKNNHIGTVNKMKLLKAKFQAKFQ